MSESNLFAAPNSMAKLRACLRCKLILPSAQFFSEGCPNCPNADIQGDRIAVEQGTTKHFTGCVGVVDSEKSWVSRHIQVETGKPGMYAITVQGGEQAEDAMADEYEEDVGEDLSGGEYA